MSHLSHQFADSFGHYLARVLVILACSLAFHATDVVRQVRRAGRRARQDATEFVSDAFAWAEGTR